MDLLKCLRELGLSGYEARVLSTLVRDGEANAKALSRESGVPMGMIYATIGKLKERGLVEEVPGKARRFTLSGAEELVGSMRSAREKRLEGERKREEALLSELGGALAKRATRDVRVRYFSGENEYLAAYVEAERLMGPKDTVKAILPVRPFHALLEKELGAHPAIAEFLGRGEKRGPGYLCLTNADSVVFNTVQTLGNKGDAARSLAKFVSHARKSGKWVYKSKNIVRNMVVFVMKDRVFFEFYSGDTTDFIAGLELRDDDAVKDFSTWFDQLFGKVRDRKAALAVFEKRLEVAARKKGIELI